MIQACRPRNRRARRRLSPRRPANFELRVVSQTRARWQWSTCGCRSQTEMVRGRSRGHRPKRAASPDRPSELAPQFSPCGQNFRPASDRPNEFCNRGNRSRRENVSENYSRDRRRSSRRWSCRSGKDRQSQHRHRLISLRPQRENRPSPGTRKLCRRDRKSTRLNSSHEWISYAVFCLKKKKEKKLLRGSAQNERKKCYVGSDVLRGYP